MKNYLPRLIAVVLLIVSVLNSCGWRPILP